MIREVISIHSGQTGIQIGSSCWELYCKEHGLTPDGTFLDPTFRGYGDGFFTFFSEDRRGHYTPRSLFVDMEPHAIKKVMTGSHRSLFDQKTMISGSESSGCSYGRAYYLGRELIEPVVDQIRRLAENCSILEAFLLFRSVGGGTGSGFSDLILDRLTADYGKKIKFDFSVYPTPKLASSVLETYNSVFSIASSIEPLECSFIFENERLYNICRSQLGIKSPTFDDMNKVVAKVVSTITANSRFPGSLSIDLSSLDARWASPFPRLHYPLLSFSSLDSLKEHNSLDKNQTLAELAHPCFEPSSRMVNCSPQYGKYLSVSMLYRGDVQVKDLKDVHASARAKYTVEFVEWTSSHFKTYLAKQSPHSLNPNADLCMVSHTSAISEVWKCLGDKFDLMWSKNAFIHRYSEGKPWGEMVEARENLRSLELDYLETFRESSEPEETG
ncbi:alpha tubulin [Flagelloscypha sp. PMI_526]|nr:alpha tubulin [Flagelloscypha sp. PMI_526]